jgi:hypothetical protein
LGDKVLIFRFRLFTPPLGDFQEGERGAARVGEKMGLTSIGCESTAQNSLSHLSSRSQRKNVKKSTVSLRYVPPKTPNPNGTEHEKRGKRNSAFF